MNKKRILFVVNVDWFFISHRLPIALEAVERGFEVHVATTVTDKLAFLVEKKIVVHPIKIKRSGQGVFGGVKEFFSICAVIRKVKPDLVHLVTIKPVLLGGLACRLLKVPAVVVAVSGLGFVFITEGLSAKLRKWIVSSIYRMVLGHSNIRIIFQNADDGYQIVSATNVARNKIEMIRGSGVELDQYRMEALPGGRPVVLFASRLLADKGVREFVAAAKKIAQEYDGRKPRFVIAGQLDLDNPTGISLDEIEDWVAQDIIEYWGFRSDMPAVLAAASLFVLPTYYGEGVPRALIEAAACGRAIITTDMPGGRDAIIPGVSGLLVRPRDVVGLIEAMLKLLNDEDLLLRMGQAGREFAENTFDLKGVIADHLRIYADLLEAPQNQEAVQERQ